MTASPANPLDELIEAAGFKTKKAFAEAAGLADYELSRISLRQRRANGTQIRKIASALKKPPTEIAALLLPEGELEQEVATNAIRERDQFMSELSEARAELLLARAQIASLGQELSRLQAEKEQLVERLAQEHARAVGLEDRQRELLRQKTELEQANGRLSRVVGEAKSEVQAIKAEAAMALSRVYHQFAELQNELGRERAAGYQRQILAGGLGMAVGAIVSNAGSGGGKSSKKKS